MMQIRFHGRGGQGAVTSAELLAQTAIAQDKYAQAFPSFGPERRGAPVVAFARIDDKPIRIRTVVSAPDYVVVLDPSILKIVNTSEGLADGGFQVINTSKSIAELRKEFTLKGKLVCINANRIAADEIGRVITNTTMLGALVRATKLVDMGLLVQQLRERFGRIAEGNIRAFKRSFDECSIEG